MVIWFFGFKGFGIYLDIYMYGMLDWVRRDINGEISFFVGFIKLIIGNGFVYRDGVYDGWYNGDGYC